MGYENTDNFDSPPIDAVDLGDFYAKAVALGYSHSCALSLNATVACWGGCYYGQCGNGNVSNIGGLPGTMGDNLDTVDLGASFQCSIKMWSPFRERRRHDRRRQEKMLDSRI